MKTCHSTAADGARVLCLVVSWFATLAAAAEPAVVPRSAWTTSRILGAPVPPEPYRIVPAFGALRFTKPTSVEELPGTGRMLVTEMSGRVVSFSNQSDVAQSDLVVDLRRVVFGDAEGRDLALFDAEPHPKYGENRFVYVTYVHPGEGSHTRLSRLTLTADSPPRAVDGSEQVILTWPAGGHNGGCLEFGVDGMLYVSTGDGSGPNPPDGLTTGQDVSDLLGSILRIDVDHPANGRAYGIPPDNPFVDRLNVRPEIWAYGLRNPWKFGIDPQAGDLFVADNGWESWEMVHHVRRGSNGGWPIMEGRVALRTEVKPGPTPIVPPAVDHPHTEANSVIGGPIYRGGKLPQLAGSFVYGDYITGTIWAVHANKEGGYSHTTLVDTDLQIVGFTQTQSGSLLILDYDFTGQIYELLPSDTPDTSAEFPRRLSETGLFKSLRTLEPLPGVEAYDVVVPRWMDGAEAQRWVAIPGTAQIDLPEQRDKSPTYPEGTVFVKQLTLPADGSGRAVRLETQLLHFAGGVWRPYSYLWDETGDDAVLVDGTGGRRLIQVADPRTGERGERTWHVNAVNECKLCHNAGAGFVLGFRPSQLNRAAPRAGSNEAHQLAWLTARRVLSRPVPTTGADSARLVDPRDERQSLVDRARSYLHVNCSMCHHPGGNAIVSFYLRRDLPFEQLNTNKGTGIGTFGMSDAKVIVAGDPYRSVLLYRMSKLGYARMPYIGSRVVDGAAVPLIEQWIRSLPRDPNLAVSPPLREGSPESHALRQLTAGGKLSPAEQQDALRVLTASTEGSLALLAQMHRGALTSETLQAAIAAGSAAPQSDIRGLFETFVPEARRRPTLGPHIDPQTILSRTGDRERGQLIYFSDGARCRACHEISERPASLGPTLREINKKYPVSAELLQHVLQPSLKVDEAFAAYTVVAEDGRTFSGLIERQSDQEIVLRTAEKRTIRLPREQVAQVRRSPKSLMPDQILSDLTAQEAADLLEYIRSLGAAP